MKKLKRYLRSDEKLTSVEQVCVSDEVTELEAEYDELYEALYSMACQHRCGCEHPQCNRCKDDKYNDAILEKANIK